MMSVDAQDFTCLSLDFVQPGAFFFSFLFFVHLDANQSLRAEDGA